MPPPKRPRCPYRCGWGAFPALAPSPVEGGPTTYQCSLEPHATGPHVLEVAGVAIERERVGRGRPETGARPRPVIAFRAGPETIAALDAEVERRRGVELLAGVTRDGVARSIVEAWAETEARPTAPASPGRAARPGP
jgi:hypothetical protein